MLRPSLDTPVDFDENPEAPDCRWFDLEDDACDLESVLFFLLLFFLLRKLTIWWGVDFIDGDAADMTECAGVDARVVFWLFR